MPSSAGELIGPYRVVRPLGRGGMGTVLLAEDPRLGRHVALKMLAGADADGPDAREHLLREARAAAALSHAHIAAVHDILDIDGQVVIVFEYVPGDTLLERLRRGPLPVPDVLRIGVQLADALADAHAHGVVHRDLKPSNIVVTGEGVAKVLDFGVARLGASAANPDQKTTIVGFAGTPGYAAPEQWLGHAVDQRMDIFALGVVLFEMLTGRRPFEGDSASVLQAMLHREPPRARRFNPAVPPALDDLVAAALSRDPSARPQHAREVRDVLRRLDDQHRATERVSFPRPPMRISRVWTTAAVLLTASMIGLIGGAGSGSETGVAAGSVPVVAVLPLANATGVPSNDYLATGMADSLTTSLASLPGVTVLSRAAVLDVWNREPSPERVARELGASHLVEGTVQQAARQVLLSVNLVGPDRSVIWADSVAGPMEEIFALQSRLATQVGRALSLRLTAADRAKLAEQPTRNQEALAAYWRGRERLERRDLSGNVDAALAAFDHAIGLDSRFAVAHAARGEALWAKYLQDRDPQLAQEAIEAGTTALRLDPNQASVRYTLALALAGSGRRDDAIEELQHALALQPHSDDARRELAQILSQQGKLEEAIIEFRKAIDLRPNYWDNHSRLGVALLQAGRYEDAAAVFERVTQLHPDNAFGYQQLGTAFHYQGRFAEALANYERAIALQPTPTAFSNLGALLHERGDFARAVEAYQAAITLRPNVAATHRNLGDAYRRLNRPREARDAYRSAARLAEIDLSVNPHNPHTLAAFAVYLAKAGDGPAAEHRLAEAHKLAPADPELLYRAAVVYALTGKHQSSLDALDQAIRLGFSRSRARVDDDFVSLRHLPRFQTLTEAAPAMEGI